MKRISDFIWALLVTGVLVTSPAQAYLDGNTISLVLQALTGATAGLLLFGKSFFARIASFFRRTPKSARGDDRKA